MAERYKIHIEKLYKFILKKSLDKPRCPWYNAIKR